MNFKAEWAIADVINTVLAIGTVIVIFLTYRSLIAARRSSEAAQKSAEIAGLSVERMKDALMPYFDIGLTSEHDSLFVTIQNLGPGLGMIRLVTVRDDIQIESALSPIEYWSTEINNSDSKTRVKRLSGFVIGPEKEFKFRFKRSTSYISDTVTWISSFSVFYEDVYGRYYLLRIIYTFSKNNDEFLAEIIGNEHIEIKELPLVVAGIFDIRQIYNYEGSKPTIYRPQFKAFYYKKIVDQLLNMKIQGTHFTGNQEVTIRNIAFQGNGYPVFYVQAGDYLPFIIRQTVSDGYPTGFAISDASLDLFFPSYDQVQPYSMYGLIAEGNDEPNIRELYSKIVDELNAALQSLDR